LRLTDRLTLLAAAGSVFVLTVVTTPSDAQDDAPSVEWSASAAWDSRYVSEGRNNLPEGGIVTAEAGLSYSGLSVTVGYLHGDQADYDEVGLSVEYGFEVSGLELYGGFTRLRFPEDDAFDNEIGAGASFTFPSGPILAIDGVYSTEADGLFLEITLSVEKELLGARATISPFIREGLDFGYATPDHDGPNNLQAGLEISYSLSDQVSLTGHASHSWAQRDVKLDGAGGVSLGGVGIAVEF